MKNSLATRISDFFHDIDDGEFLCSSREVPYSFVGLTQLPGRFIFTTKPSVVSVLVAGQPLDSFGMVGRCGLPHEYDPAWLDELTGPNEFQFLGDLDPVDIMVFTWLRERLHQKSVNYLGISDTLIQRLALTLSESSAIPCGPSELRAIRTFNAEFESLSETIGVQCAALLKRGRKMELELLLHADRSRFIEVLTSL